MAKKVESVNTEKSSLIEEAIGKIEKEYGKGSIVRLGDKSVAKMDVIPTQCLSLDIALGVGGFPKGRIIEIYGPESSGKTTLALHAIASCQAQGGTVVFIDAEHALDAVYAKKLGVDIDNLYVIQPDSGEQALDNLDTLVRSNSVDLIVVDSVAALTPRAEIEGEVGQSVIGLQARMMSQGLRRITSIISKANTCVIFINQLREKVGVMFGNPETTPGGKALKFYSSIRIDVRKGDAIKDGSEVIGNRTKAKIIKNKVAPPFKVAEFDIYYGKGISQEGSIIDLALANGIMQKSGSWISYNDEKIAQGRDKAVQYLQDNPELTKEITKIIMDKIEGAEEAE